MTREEVHVALLARLAESKRAIASNFNPAVLGTVVVNNQISMLDALAYLVEHQSEQAWKSNPAVIEVCEPGDPDYGVMSASVPAALVKRPKPEEAK